MPSRCFHQDSSQQKSPQLFSPPGETARSQAGNPGSARENQARTSKKHPKQESLSSEQVTPMYHGSVELDGFQQVLAQHGHDELEGVLSQQLEVHLGTFLEERHEISLSGQLQTIHN